MNKTLRDKVNSLLASYGVKLSEEAPQPVTLSVTAKTADGIEIGSPADAWGQGVEVYINGEEGPMPAADGEYILEDGTVVVVAAGMVAEIKAPTEEMSAEVEAAIKELGEQVSEAKKENETLSAALAAEKQITADLQAKLKAAETKSVALSAEVATLKKTPAAPSVKSKTELSAEKPTEAKKPLAKMTIEERIAHLREVAKHN